MKETVKAMLILYCPHAKSKDPRSCDVCTGRPAGGSSLTLIVGAGCEKLANGSNTPLSQVPVLRVLISRNPIIGQRGGQGRQKSRINQKREVVKRRAVKR